MNIPYPIGLIIILVALSLFYYLNRKAQNRREARREKLKEKRQQYLESLLSNKDSERENPTHNS